MTLIKWLIFASFAACTPVIAGDLFFIVGHAGTRLVSEEAQSGKPAEVKLVRWDVGSKFTSIDKQRCKKENCSAVTPVDGVLQAFANTWTSKSKRPAHFLIYRKPDAALTKTGADGKAYWTDFETSNSVYQEALSAFRKVQLTGPLGEEMPSIDRRYLIWMQNEVDARASVSAENYETKLIELFNRFNKDLQSEGGPFDAIFIVSSGLVRDAFPGAPNQNDGTLNSISGEKLNAIVEAQDRAAAQGKIVLISRSMRRSLIHCSTIEAPRGCAATDQLRYHTWLYEVLGEEMARNAYTYHSKKIKPLLPEDCKQEPTSCAGTVDIFRWAARGNAKSTPVFGTDPNEFDAAAHHVSRTYIALFKDSAAGRIPLYRSSDAGGSGLDTKPASPSAKALGYCYAAPKGNANVKLMLIQQEGITSLARLSAEAGSNQSLAQEGDKTLCYLN